MLNLPPNLPLRWKIWFHIKLIVLNIQSIMFPWNVVKPALIICPILALFGAFITIFTGKDAMWSAIGGAAIGYGLCFSDLANDEEAVSKQDDQAHQ